MAFDINKLSQREKTIVGMLIVVLASLPFFYLTLPSWNSYTNSSLNAIQNEKKLTDLNRQISRLEKLKGQNAKLVKQLDVQKLYLAKSYEVDFLVQDLKKICDESLVSLESFTPSNPEPINVVLEKQIQAESAGRPLDRSRMKQTLDKLKGQALPIDLYRVPIEVRITGNFTDLLQLFRQLEKYGRVISVEDISISKIQAKGATGDRLSRAKAKKQKEDTGSLYSTFDLIAYTAAKEQETLPFSELKKTVTGTGKFSIKSKRTRE